MSQKKSTRYYQAIVLGLFVIAVIGLKLWEFRWPSATLQLKGETIDVMVAKTPKHRYRGLGQRDTLGIYDGMLFVFPTSGRMGFVMRDMRFPIDIVWFFGGEVVDIAPNVPIEPGVPENELRVYYPRDIADMVLELPAGWVDRYGVRIGDKLSVIDE